jgi:hypothetical protein
MISMQKTARMGLGCIYDAWECSVFTLESTSMGTTIEHGEKHPISRTSNALPLATFARRWPRGHVLSL